MFKFYGPLIVILSLIQTPIAMANKCKGMATLSLEKSESLKIQEFAHLHLAAENGAGHLQAVLKDDFLKSFGAFVAAMAQKGVSQETIVDQLQREIRALKGEKIVENQRVANEVNAIENHKFYNPRKIVGISAGPGHRFGSMDKNYLATKSSALIKVFDLHTSELVAELENKRESPSTVHLKDGYVAVGWSDGSVEIKNLAADSPSQKIPGQVNDHPRVKISDGFLVVESAFKKTTVVSLKNFEDRFEVPHVSDNTATKVSDGFLLVTSFTSLSDSSKVSLKVVNLKTKKTVIETKVSSGNDPADIGGGYAAYSHNNKATIVDLLTNQKFEVAHKKDIYSVEIKNGYVISRDVSNNIFITHIPTQKRVLQLKEIEYGSNVLFDSEDHAIFLENEDEFTVVQLQTPLSVTKVPAISTYSKAYAVGGGLIVLNTLNQAQLSSLNSSTKSHMDLGKHNSPVGNIHIQKNLVAVQSGDYKGEIEVYELTRSIKDIEEP